jgi:hypothetical protein
MMQKGDSYTLDSGSIFCSMYRMHNSSQGAKISVKRTPTSIRTLQIPNMNRNKRMVQNFGLFLGALQQKKTIRLTFFKRYGAEFDINSLYAIENLTGSLSAMKKKSKFHVVHLNFGLCGAITVKFSISQR